MSDIKQNNSTPDSKAESARNILLFVSVGLNIVLGAWLLNSLISPEGVSLADNNSMNRLAEAVSPAYQAQVRTIMDKPANNLLDAELAHRQASQHFVALLAKENVTREELVEVMGQARLARNTKNAAYHEAFAELLATLPLEERLKIRDTIVGPGVAE